MTTPGPTDAVQLEETHDLEPFRREMGAIPDRADRDRPRRPRR